MTGLPSLNTDPTAGGGRLWGDAVAATAKELAKVRAKLPKSVSSPINAAKRHKKNKDQLAFIGPTPAEMFDTGKAPPEQDWAEGR